MRRKKNIIWPLLLIGFTNIFAQEYSGRDFHVAFIDWDGCLPIPASPGMPVIHPYWYDTAELFLSSPHSARVIIGIDQENFPGSGVETAYQDTVYLLPGRTQHILLPLGVMCRFFFSDLVTRNGIHISSDTPIYVKASTRHHQLNGSTAVLPSSSLPKAPEYIIGTNEGSGYYSCFAGQGWNPSSCSQFVIVGTAAESKIEITPNSASLNTGTKANNPFTITLRQGETFHYIGTADTGTLQGKDLSGTVIRSRTPESGFSVFAGNKSSSSTLKNRTGQKCTDYPDYIYEQLWPVQNWGRQYTALPIPKQSGAYFLKIISLNDDNQVMINGYPYDTLQTGTYTVYNELSDTPALVSSTHPVAVFQFSRGPGCNLYPAPHTDYGNLSMVQLVPDALSAGQTHIQNCGVFPNTFYASSTPEFFGSIMVKTPDTAHFRHNGKKIPPSKWKKTAAGSLHSYTSLSLDTGLHVMSCGGDGLIAYARASGMRKGTAYTAAGRLQVLNSNFVFDRSCKNDTTVFTATNTDSFGMHSWKTENGTATGTGTVFRHVFADTGRYRVVMYSRHKISNRADSVVKYIRIGMADNTPVLCGDTLICGQVGFVLAAKGLNYFNSYLWNGGHPFYAQYMRNPGMYWLQVTERNGCRYTDTLIIRSTPRPVASLSMSDTLICSNRNRPVVFANLSYSDAEPIISCTWDFGQFNPVDTNLDTVRHLYTRTGQYLIKMKVVTDVGCEDDTFAFFEMLKGPRARFSIPYKDTCLRSNSVVFLNQTAKDTTLHKRYKWYFSEGYVISNNDPSGPRRYDSSGIYTANLIYEYSNGCIDTARRTISIYEHPDADFDMLNPVLCDGDSVRFINKTGSAHQPLSYVWDFGDAASDTAGSPVHLYGNRGRYRVKLKATTPQNCPDSLFRYISVFGASNASFSVNDTDQCLRGNRFVFNNLSVSDTGSVVSALWKFSDGLTDTSVGGMNRIFAEKGMYKVVLTVANAFGCIDSSIRKVLVRDDPEVRISVNDISQCQHSQQFDFTHTLVRGDSLLSFQWFLPGGALPVNTEAGNIQFGAPGIYPVLLRTISKDQCQGFDSLSVMVNPAPVALFSATPEGQCLKNNFITLQNESTGAETWDWDLGNGTGSTLQDPGGIRFTDEGTYLIRLVAVSDSACKDTHSVAVNIHPQVKGGLLPVVPVCPGDTVRFLSNLSLSSGVIDTYRWDFGGGEASVAPVPEFVFMQSGIFPVKLFTVTDKGCRDTFEVPGHVSVMDRPEVEFRYYTEDLGDGRTRIRFVNESDPYRNASWTFNPFGSRSGRDTALTIEDSFTLTVRLLITGNNGCTNSEEKRIFVSGPLKLYFPGAFSPDGNLINDGFGPEGIDFAYDYTFTIFNRWGEIVFKSSIPGDKWDGTFRGSICQQGQYIYTVTLRDFMGRFQEYRGTVLLLR